MMFRVTAGCFVPELEDALLEDVRQLRAADPWRPITVLVPSRWVADRLARRAAESLGGAAAGVEFLTLFAAAVRAAGPAPAFVADTLFHSRLLLEALDSTDGISDSLRAFASGSIATAQALLGVMRDLRDAALAPADFAVAVDAVEDPVFRAEEAPLLRDLAHLYAGYCKGLKRAGVEDRAAVFLRAAERIETEAAPGPPQAKDLPEDAPPFAPGVTVAAAPAGEGTAAPPVVSAGEAEDVSAGVPASGVAATSAGAPPGASVNASAGASPEASAGAWAGAPAGASPGALAGALGGAPPGASAGASAGAAGGASAGASTAASAGPSAGAPAGASQGAPADAPLGASASAPAGATPEALAGASPSASAGSSGGASQGASAGAAEGPSVGRTPGASAGVAARQAAAAPSDVLAALPPGVPEAPPIGTMVSPQPKADGVLARFGIPLVYGFYDVTQVQWDFIEALVRAAHGRGVPCAIYVPIVPDHPAWKFAQPFYDSWVSNLAARLGGEKCVLPRRDRGCGKGPATRAAGDLVDVLFLEAKEEEKQEGRSPVAKAGSVRLFSAAGTRDEVAEVARDIVRAVLDDGLHFDEIAVVARALDGYAEAIRDVFGEHGIPWRTSAALPSAASPWVKIARRLADLPDSDFDRAAVMEAVTSPLFRAGANSQERALWDLATRAVRITRGRDLWTQRLRRLRERQGSLPEQRDRDRFEDIPRSLKIDPESIERLEQLIAQIEESFPAGCTRWSEWVSAFEQYFQRWLPEVPAPILDAVRRLKDFDCIRPEATRDEFRQWLQRCLHAVELDRPDAPRGVYVLDVQALRGLSFRRLYLLGLNDGVFPRVVAPEPFLSDDARRAIVDVLGHRTKHRPRLAEKLAGYDEERLLLALTLEAAEEMLVLSYQRADETGRKRAPSVFWDAILECLPNHKEVRNVPRSFSERMRDDTIRSTLSPIETAAFRPIPTLRVPPPRIELPDDFWTKLTRRPFSPTAIQTYRTCPFQFFAQRLLGLAAVEDPAEEGEDLSALHEGSLMDEILTRYYRDNQPLKKAAQDVFENYERTGFPLPPAVWNAAKNRIIRTLETFLEAERAESSNFRPAEFQKEITKEIEVAGNPILFTGILDRMDRDGETGRVRVVDYKRSYWEEEHGAPCWENNVMAFDTVQPALYALLAGAHQVDFVFLRSFLLYDYAGTEDWETARRRFRRSLGDPESWRDAFLDRLGQLLELLRQGHFFLIPEDGDRHGHCGFCDFATMCRKNHRPTRRTHERSESRLAFDAIFGKEKAK